MSVQLLDKIRKVNRLLHNNAGYKISIDELCGLFGSLLYSDVIITNQHGKIIGQYVVDGVPAMDTLRGLALGEEIDADMNERFMSVLSTKENVNLSMLGLAYDGLDLYDAIIVPVDMAGERLGTVFSYRIKNSYEIDDIILAEYVTTIVAMEMLHDLYDTGAADNYQENLVHTAIRALSASELYAAKCVLEELAHTKGVLVTTRVAEKYNITRSVIINAMKKLNSAGVIRSRSMGIKGTAIQIENPYIMEALTQAVAANN
ncbi:MAG: GTP-sensing pleiotropic transcriptional regulator CodY [Wujia sp.]